MRIHMPGLYHTITSQSYSHCAFTGKVLRFSKMMKAQGFEVIEYGNEGSESEASEHVVLRSRERFESLHPRKGFVGEGSQVKLGSESHLEFGALLLQALRARVRPGDIVAHPLGPTHAELVTLVPQGIHVETGIGYESGPFGCAARIFETETWRHWHLGKYGYNDGQGPSSWVCPNYYDLEDWPLGEGKGGYFAFMARKCNAKGLKVLAEIINAYRGPHHFRIAGQGEEWSDWKEFVGGLPLPLGGASCVHNVGELRGRERAKFLGDAVALLCPTQFVEPFGGASIEAMLCGTPAIGSAWGAYVETLPRWAQCRTTEDWLEAMGEADTAPPAHRTHPEFGRAARAADLYSLEAVGRHYAHVFEAIQKAYTSP